MSRRAQAGGMLHPATMYLFLTGAVVLLSWICNVYGMSVMRPDTGEEIMVQSLLSPEGIRWGLRSVVANFTGFAPLGLVMVAMFGIGLGQHAGFMDACIRWILRGRACQGKVLLGVILLGLLSNVAGDAGYIILLPVAVLLFRSAGMHPAGGIVVAYVSAGCGYSANILLCTLDARLASVTREATGLADMQAGGIGPLCNYYFFAVSTLLLTGIIYVVTQRSLLPRLGNYRSEVPFAGRKCLSRKERRALQASLATGLAYILIVVLATFSPWGILRGVNGGLANSPFIESILFLVSFGVGLMGMVYGFMSGRYRSDAEVIDGLVCSMQLLGVYFVIAFFASQMFACLEYSRLDRCMVIKGAEMLSLVRFGGLGTLVLFIFFTAAANLVMVSATAKWAFMSFIFVPVLGSMDVPPEVTQCAFRIGDSATNALTPFMFYMPLALAYMHQYVPATYVQFFRYTWRYAVSMLLAWVALFVVWYLCGLPWGM